MTTRDLLRANHEKILEQYRSNLEGLLTLQTTLIYDILPSVVDELGLGPDASEWAKQWLEDTSSLFRISRRNNFTRSFAMEAVRKTLIWRFSNLWPVGPSQSMPIMHCLPGWVRDPFGRPILVIKAVSTNGDSGTLKARVIQTFERLRILMKHFVAEETSGPQLPTLQYIILVDLKEFSYKNFNIDLITWIIREVIPRFPGLLAGVFVLNYTWMHGGIWNIVKRILPASALSRVFFPSQEELIRYFTRLALPKDYGGSLPFLTQLDDPLRIHEPPLIIPHKQTSFSPSPSQPPAFSSITSLSPTSLLNPYFGYPISSTHGSPFLHHGRRRKRDLLRTLAVLLWARWRKFVIFGLLIALGTLTFRRGVRKDPLFLRSLMFPQRLIHSWGSRINILS
ncbi:CRAL-TRIO domain-containing protein [Collybia nuda]|uniref:CRAL-TRIO domain-containing protein n=1 Tax=Collybia nuda TaxID=64659 RepID=A0A9P5Y556_9AGAR|nr:CRAL-TRIO domain-containing protein [Collybia nuda]